MAEQIITKRCCACKQIKPVSEFSKDHSRKDGYCYQCKVCRNRSNKAYQQTEKGRKSNVKSTTKYYQTKRGRIAIKAYQQSKVGKDGQRQRDVKYHNRFPEGRKARDAVVIAIRSGKLPHPDTLKCSCGKQAKHYHHHKGYEPKHYLDVVPVCVPCHNKIPNVSHHTRTPEKLSLTAP